MIKLENISIELKKINNEAQLLSIKELIDKIDQEIKESAAIYKPSDKKQIAAIKKYLSKNEKARPVLSCWTPLKENKVAFTNSYSAFILDKITLPFKVAFSNKWNEEEKKEFSKNNNIEKKDIDSAAYPNIENCFPNEMDQLETLKLNIDSFLSWFKVQDKKRMSKSDLLYNLGDDLEPFYVNPIYLKDLIDIMQLKNTVCIEYYGEYKPVVFRTEAGKNAALLLPVKKY